jgi:hypothetical protein
LLTLLCVSTYAMSAVQSPELNATDWLSLIGVI